MQMTRRLAAATTFRNVLLPGLAGVLLNAISFYEVGLKRNPNNGSAIRSLLSGISQYYFETGLLGLAIASIVLSAIATRYGIAWLAFYTPGLVARIVTGTVLFLRGDANMWPMFLAGDIAFAIFSLGIFWMVAKFKNKALSRSSEKLA